LLRSQSKQEDMTITLPINEIIPAIKEKLVDNDNLVLQAPPGAGKTTVVPIELVNEGWLGNKKIIMLEPRRLAARAAAKRMAETLGEKVGETVGYRVRMDSKVGPSTRIEVVTEGILIRKLQSDPEIADVGLLIFDEFHERSIEADLGLALSLDVQCGLREDLKILVMSATLDGDRVASLMNDAPLLSSAGRSYSIEHRYLEKKIIGSIEQEVSRAILAALQTETGSMLVFLPGAGEIERTKKILEEKNLGSNILICPLYGMMTFPDQDRAISSAPKGVRKIVLSTDIAETSLTIEGIRIVVDAGLQRSAVYDVRSGMTGLETITLSKASADQRAGRAGRLEEGICYRLWTEPKNRALKPFSEPEIRKVDLVPLALDLALWGVGDAASLKWLDVPDPVSVSRAKELLVSLGAVDHDGRITDHGTVMARFPMHPRLAHMILVSQRQENGMLALTIAALMQERDLLNLKPEMRTADLRLRIEALEHVKAGRVLEAKKIGCNIARAKTINRQISVWQEVHKIKDAELDIESAGKCLAIAFPDRIAGRREKQSSSYIMSGGRGAKLLPDDPLALESFLAVAQLDKGEREARIFIAAPILKLDIETNFADLVMFEEKIEWDNKTQVVKAQNKKMLGKMPVAFVRTENPDEQRMKSEMIFGIRKMGFATLPWCKKSESLCRRVELIRSNIDIDFVNLSESHLMETLEEWLEPYLENIYSRAALNKLDLYAILKSTLSWDQQQLIEKLTPTQIRVPSGSNISIDYDVKPPILSVKLQEMFGMVETPKILDGRVALSIHLLSPARRPLQITSDMAGFWKNSYPEIKKEMKGRYPKHPWPDNPFVAAPTRKLKPKI